MSDRMNKGLQKHQIRRSLKKRGVDPQTVDVEAHIDSSLHLDENMDRMIEKGIMPQTEEDRATGVDYKRRQEQLRPLKRSAEFFHDDRSQQAQWTDEAKQNDDVIGTGRSDLAPTDDHLDEWVEDPGRVDVQGVDDRRFETIGMAPALEQFKDRRDDRLERAVAIHEQRPEAAQRVDEGREAEQVFSPINLTENQFEMWREEPEQHDIRGLDTQEDHALIPEPEMMQDNDEPDEEVIF